jgi:hypothetical protein
MPAAGGFDAHVPPPSAGSALVRATRCAAIARAPAFDPWLVQSEERSGSKGSARATTAMDLRAAQWRWTATFAQAGQDALLRAAGPVASANGAEAAEVSAGAGDAYGPARRGSS